MKHLKPGSILIRNSILFYFNAAFGNIPEEQNLCLLCSCEKPFDNDDETIEFYLYGDKIKYADKLIIEFNFDKIDGIPTKKLYHISGYKDGLLKITY